MTDTARKDTSPPRRRIVLFANTDWYLYNFRLSLLLRLREKGYEVIAMSPPGDHGPRLVELGFRWRPLPMDRRSLNPFREARLLSHIAGILREERADIVHGFTIKAAVYGGLAGRMAGTRGRVSAVAGLGWVFNSAAAKARLLRPFVHSLLRLALGGKGARLIVQNPDDLALFQRTRIMPRNRMRLIKGSGVDLSRFTVAATPRAPGAPLRVLLAARLLWDKGLEEFVDAARALKADGRHIEFLLAGDPDPGNPEAASLETVRSWVDDGLVQWLGHVNDMPGLLRSVDVVALPSRYGEGLPKVLIEAAGGAHPLITTNEPGCREVVTDGVEGFLIPSRDAPALARAIAAFDDDPELVRSMGRAARDRALREFDHEIVMARTLEVYEELLGGGRAAHAAP